MRDDVVRLILWAGVVIGAVTVGTSLGDPRHLRCLTFGGATLAGFSLLMILRSVILRRSCPAVAVLDASEVTGILEAPSVASQVAQNAQQIEELRGETEQNRRRIGDCFEIMSEAAGAAGVHLPDHDDTSPLPKISLVRPGRRKGDSQAGLCLGPVGPSLLVLGGP